MGLVPPPDPRLGMKALQDWAEAGQRSRILGIKLMIVVFALSLLAMGIMTLI